MPKSTSLRVEKIKNPLKKGDTSFMISSSGLAKYQSLFDSDMLGIATTDFKDKIISANNTFLSIIGYSQEDLSTGKLTWSTISPKKYNKTDERKIEELITRGQIVPFEKQYIHKKGHVVSVLVGAEMSDTSASLGVCFALDISKLKELEQKKDDFIGIVSHELKTPIAIMKLHSSFLQSSIEDNAPRQELLEYANEIDNQIDRINILITDLLNMARHEAHKPVFDISAMNLSDCITQTAKSLAALHTRTIKVSGSKTIFVKGNNERIAEVVTNLVNNAVRYSNADTHIEIAIKQDARKAYVSITDHGMGIKDENFAKIFDRYYRVNHASDYADVGVGIGLYVCNEIIKHHKGKISVTSKLGKGSTFTIELPRIQK